MNLPYLMLVFNSERPSKFTEAVFVVFVLCVRFLSSILTRTLTILTKVCSWFVLVPSRKGYNSTSDHATVAS